MDHGGAMLMMCFLFFWGGFWRRVMVLMLGEHVLGTMQIMQQVKRGRV
jgi:hypothetical protein